MSCDLVVMGASWGGLAALECLLSGLPPDFPAAIAVAQHRSPASDSEALTALLSQRTGHEVREVSDKDPITPGRVNLAPADYHLLVEPDCFSLSVDAAVQYSRPSIDILFDSAADVYADRLIGVILTGANEDGAHGIKRIKRRGGYTIAQDPDTAEKRTMPDAAIATGAVDAIVPIERMAELLTKLADVPVRRQGTAPRDGYRWSG